MGCVFVEIRQRALVRLGNGVFVFWGAALSLAVPCKVINMVKGPGMLVFLAVLIGLLFHIPYLTDEGNQPLRGFYIQQNPRQRKPYESIRKQTG